jgi:thiamine biosynthesis lipoprotein
MLKQFFETKPVLGSDATIMIVVDKDAETEKLFQDLWHQIFSFERQFSRFLPSSELSIFNNRAGIKQFITPEFRRLLLASKKMAAVSKEMYNPFILPALQRAGYKGSAMPGYELDAVDDHSKKHVANAKRLLVGSDWAEIPYGTAIDMGGCGKGYLADQLADTMDKEHLGGFWISLGGDMVVVGTDENGQPWDISVQSADTSMENAPLIINNQGERIAIATSGTFRRQNQQGSKKTWHHLIDPRTLQPAKTDILLTTVVDDSALRADVFASSATILGSKQALSYLKELKVRGALIQTSANNKIQLKKFGRMLKNPLQEAARV